MESAAEKLAETIADGSEALWEYQFNRLTLPHAERATSLNNNSLTRIR